MAKRARQVSKYPRVTTYLPPHLHARLQAASTVLRTPIYRLIETALEEHFEGVDETTLELIDRVASEVLVRTEQD